ncbi:hypothetical protein [Ignatzschineria cameli]|uniref:hypothetical protein n=1 Tax=Ignatzschineria cameli TaxID=2182793 RepID=UPI000D605067|nr:hypothetical protein [Ignatzschineria cameli]PWD86046.1 hypothetical protein DC080_04630 [Ignatzschineria cameli]
MKDNIEYRVWNDSKELFFSRRSILKCNSYVEDYLSIDKYEVIDNKIFISGCFLVQGYEAKDWGDISYYLLLKSSENIYSFRLGLVNDDNLDLTLDNGFGVYRKCAFATPNYKGIELGHLTDGYYDMEVVLSKGGSVLRRNTRIKLVKKERLLLVFKYDMCE